MIRRALVVAMMLLPATAMAQEPTLVEPGKLTWATAPTFIPFEFMKDSKPVGFDVDMMDELGKRVHLTPVVMALEFKGVMPALIGKRVDLAVSGLYITAERLTAADMIPYALIGNQIVVKKGNPKHLSDPASLCGAKVAAAIATVFEASVKTQSEACVAAGKPAIELLSVPGSNLVALAIVQGRADAGVTSNAAVAAMTSETPDTYEAAGEPYDATTKLGIALNKDNPMLKAALQTALDGMAKDGTYAKLLAKWNLPAKSSVY
jgi:polar amino acid transport system substrate-binding protein